MGEQARETGAQSATNAHRARSLNSSQVQTAATDEASSGQRQVAIRRSPRIGNSRSRARPNVQALPVTNQDRMQGKRAWSTMATQNKETNKGEIRIGSEYQAVIPDYHESEQDDCDREVPLWLPPERNGRDDGVQLFSDYYESLYERPLTDGALEEAMNCLVLSDYSVVLAWRIFGKYRARLGNHPYHLSPAMQKREFTLKSIANYEKMFTSKVTRDLGIIRTIHHRNRSTEEVFILYQSEHNNPEIVKQYEWLALL